VIVSAIVLAVPGPPPGKGPEWGKAAPIGLLIILLLGAAFWLLMRSMNKHLRKVNSADPAAPSGGQPASLGATGEFAADDPSTSDGRPASADPSADAEAAPPTGEQIDLVKHRPDVEG